jgi:D-alanine--poly(phosphoribitol) ligase subunit 2
MTEGVQARVQAIAVRVLGTAAVDPDVDLIEQGLLDSLGLVELLVGVEQEFELEIPPEELQVERFRSVNAMTELVESMIERTVSDRVPRSGALPGTSPVSDTPDAADGVEGRA